MPKLRPTVGILPATAVIAAAALMVPQARRTLTQGFHGFGGPFRQAARAPVLPPRETTAGQAGPNKLTARVADDGPPGVPATTETTPVSAAQNAASPATEVDPPSGPTLAQTDPDADRVRQAIALYRKGDLTGGDAIAKTAVGAVARLSMEWAALRLQIRQVSLQREQAFASAHPDWPASTWLRRRMEETIAGQAADVTGSIGERLAGTPPETLAGKLVLARFDRAHGQVGPARGIMGQVWRTEDLTAPQETYMLREFGDLLDKTDHKARADELLYKEQVPAALRAAALAGPDVLLLAKARAAVIANAASDAAIAAVPKPLQTDPGLLFARIQKARRANRVEEAAGLMQASPRDPEQLVDGDAWWVERRILARKLLDTGEPRRAFQIVCEHAASTAAMKVEAEFHAGWIALSFLREPKLAEAHFARIADLAETPISRSRAAYWRGRAAEAIGDEAGATAFYEDAARYSISFYGQLAAAKIGKGDLALRTVAAPAVGDARNDAVKVADYLFAVGAREVALPLAIDVARFDPSESQVAAMGAVVEKARDAWATLAVGKTATLRGMALDDTAFPTFGIPEFQPLRKSADLATVYAIARQESEFDQKSLSSAGAKGLMQMIPSTARRTADHAGVSYDDTRLGSDAAFNAQLGAAHLGELLDEQGGSYILTFAAYNAGGKNVKDWIDAYGDPRKPGVDPVDWIERIPFTETRNYVQRVMENLQIYRVRLGHPTSLVLGTEASPARGKGT